MNKLIDELASSIGLDNNESKIYKHFFENKGKVLTYKNIKLAIWGSEYVTDSSVRYYVCTIRRKIGYAPNIEAGMIYTCRNGYMFKF